MYNNAYCHRYLILLQTHKVKSFMIPLCKETMVVVMNFHIHGMI